MCADYDKKSVSGSQEMMRPSSILTIAAAMKRRLKTNNRTLSTKHLKTLSADSWRLIIEVAIMHFTFLCI